MKINENEGAKGFTWRQFMKLFGGKTRCQP